MKNLLSPIIILVIILVVVAMGLFAYKLFSDDGSGKGGSANPEDLIAPTLELSIDETTELQDVVTIYATASTEDELGIKSITLPDGTEVETDSATFEATENKKYVFKVKGNNGAEASLPIEISNIRISSAESPYIPKGFEHVGGTVEDGFTIEDEIGNQYVWVPIASGKVTRNTMLDSNFIESTNSASALVNSVAKNYGFYIGRYEASQMDVNGTKIAASMPGKTPWTNITYIDANNVSATVAETLNYPEGYSTAIINSFVWDTTLKWIDEKYTNFSSLLNYGNYSGQIYPTGTTESDIVNNICDLAGNVREWTTEIFKGATTTSSKKNSSTQEQVLYRVVRGGSASLNKTPISHVGYPENMSDNYWGFRTILFKD